MKTTKELCEMTPSQLVAEEELAYEYWKNVRTISEYKKLR